MNHHVLEILKLIAVASILFVWVVRYSNIVEEFRFYSLPNWLRDIVGILKISCAFMLLNSNAFIVQVGAIGIASLMVCAIFTHFRVKNPFPKMLPATTLLIFNLLIFYFSA